MDFIFIAMGLLAFIAVMCNVLLIWYIRNVMRRSSLKQDVTNDMLRGLEEFLTHLEHVHELPLFYGDETLKGLLQHSRELAEDVRSYRDGFIFGHQGAEFDNEEEERSPEEE